MANAGSIAVAKNVTDMFSDLDELRELGEIQLKMSGCINACGHHHVGHIGVLGVNKRGEEYYQIMLGGSAAEDASWVNGSGLPVAKSEVAPAIRRLVDCYRSHKQGDERFLDTYRRIGRAPFKEGCLLMLINSLGPIANNSWTLAGADTSVDAAGPDNF